AEDGIRDWSVTGVQTCALPIWPRRPARARRRGGRRPGGRRGPGVLGDQDRALPERAAAEHRPQAVAALTGARAADELADMAASRTEARRGGQGARRCRLAPPYR